MTSLWDIVLVDADSIYPQNPWGRSISQMPKSGVQILGRLERFFVDQDLSRVFNTAPYIRESFVMGIIV